MSDKIKADLDVPKPKTNDDDDLDLNELLDNALGDFDKHSQLPPPIVGSDDVSKPKKESSETVGESKNSLPSDINEALPELIDEEALKKLMSQLEQTVDSLFADEDDEGMAELSKQFSTDFKKIAEDTMKEMKEETGSSENEFAATISETLKNLSENAGSLQGSGNDLINMLEALGIDDDNVHPDFPSLFNNIMQMFLSKDILYPALKELVSKYPQWLEENKSTITKDDYTRYSKQLEIMSKVCSVMETATDSDDEEVKSKRFSVILGLMQEIQDYGHPPKSLIGDTMDIPSWW